MAVSESYKLFVDEQLGNLEGWYSKKMFGGVGYFIDGVIFGCIMGGVFRLKADAESSKKFTKLGMSDYEIPTKNMSMPYFEVPPSILEDKDALKEWSLESLEISKKKKK